MKKLHTHKKRLLSLLLALTMFSVMMFSSPIYAAEQPSATIGDVTVSGKVGEAIQETKFIITAQNASLYDFIGESCDSWFKNLPAGLTANAKTYVQIPGSVEVTISGTPTEKLTAPMEIVIQSADVDEQVDIPVTLNPNAKWDISPDEKEAPSATIGDVTVSGKVGEAIQETKMIVTAHNASLYDFIGESCAYWFKNLPAGLKANAKTYVQIPGSVEVTIFGTPTEKLTAPMEIVIQSADVDEQVDIPVTLNPNAKWDISPDEKEAPSATIADVTVSGKVGEAIQETKMIITAKNASIYDFVGESCDSWFKNLPAGLKASAHTYVQIPGSVEVTISGTPTEKLTAPMEIVIQSADVDEQVDIPVTLNPNAKWDIGSTDEVPPSQPSTSTPIVSPKTGENSNITILLILACVSALAGGYLLKNRVTNIKK